MKLIPVGMFKQIEDSVFPDGAHSLTYIVAYRVDGRCALAKKLAHGPACSVYRFALYEQCDDEQYWEHSGWATQVPNRSADDTWIVVATEAALRQQIPGCRLTAVHLIPREGVLYRVEDSKCTLEYVPERQLLFMDGKQMC